MGTLYINASIYTMRDEYETVEAVFCRDGKIEAAGFETSIREEFQEFITTVIDLKGGMMIPGLTDSHLHLIGHGEKLIRLDLSALTSAEDLLEVLKLKASLLEENEWLIGDGWNENNFPDVRIVSREELDRISGGRPVFISRVCRHAFLANSKALSLAGITKDTEDPAGGIIHRDERGEPTGLLMDSAADLVKKVIPQAEQHYLNRALEASVKDLLSKGIVGAHSEDLSYYGGFRFAEEAFKNVLGRKGIPFKAHLLVHHLALEEVLECEPFTSPYVEYGALKIFSDGAFGGRTALLSEPYSDDPETNGVCIHSAGQLAELVQLARKHRMAAAVHTIGDKSLEMVIDAFEKTPPPIGKKDRIIHAGLVREDLVARMKELPVIIDIQPGFVSSDFPWLIERLGEDRVRYAFAFRTLLDHNIICAGGSDAPIEPANPLLGLYAAVHRRKPGETHEGYVPAQKLTMYEAIQLYTTGSAAAIGKENSQGIIAPGYCADFTVFGRDLFKTAPEEILQTKVLYTIVDGQTAYSSQEVRVI
ncbi:amidohydrolase [Fictibacillus aquaticus]|uniref:Amidohydrolase n=1 Tax=Fictibacillus aquaticus TaxID=2021314 RepID=A0A235FAI6_9BACL|nr:amidohydrolase [Fictibacillus aquaticus]OYD58209.1 amidohydrolase [Fictibacillus aquaticus]